MKPDGTLDVIPFSAQAEYELKPRQRVIGLAYISTLCAIVASARIPAFFRLLGLQLAAYAFSAFEYCFHRWCMHSTYGTWRDKIFSRWNRLHVQHHLDTNDDMTMVEGYNWKGIRFNYLTSIVCCYWIISIIPTSEGVAVGLTVLAHSHRKLDAGHVSWGPVEQASYR